MARLLTPDDLDRLMADLAGRGFELRGPVLEGGVVQLRPVATIADFPRGVGDAQAPGRYRTSESGSDEFFGFAVGPSSMKEHLFPARRPVWRSEVVDGQIGFRTTIAEAAPLAFIGVRPCDLAAVAVQDRVLLGGEYVDPDYSARRKSAVVIVVNCTHPSETCFCGSMGTGPRAGAQFDLALTEVRTPERHFFVADVGSEMGAALLDPLDLREATPDEEALVERLLHEAKKSLTKTLDTTDLPSMLGDAASHPRWEHIAERCLACTNCTLVCPTCFCVSTEPISDLEGGSGEDRRWDSCFTLDFSFMGGQPTRASVASRYRQWLTHKLSSWVDQFGTFGCVGCGRCITWCPVGIDLTEEARLLREHVDA